MADDIAPESLTLHTADGLALQAESRTPDGATAAVVLAHPHPAQGGSMHSLVTSEMFRVLPTLGLACLRFNFRGVGDSEGTHGGGRPERIDVETAAIAWHEARPGLSLVVCGWSFGADVSASVLTACVDGWVLIAPPLRVLPPESFVAGGDDRPKLLIVPENDPFCAPPAARERTADWTNTTMEIVAGADHFLAGRTDRVAELVAAFAATLAVEP